MNTTASILATCALLACACSAAHAADSDAPKGYSLKLVKAVEGPNAGKPAEIFANREDDKSNTVVNAAVLLRDVDLPGVAGLVSNSWGASAGLSKNTLTGKRSDLLTLSTGIYSRWAVSQDKRRTLDSSLDLLLENDRENRARSRALAFDVTLRGPMLYDPQLDPGQMGLAIGFEPGAGIYRRKVSSTDDAAAAPVGSHGGPYLAAHLNARWVWAFPTPDLPLFDRISVDVVARYTRDSSASGGYSSATYRFAEVSLDYLLAGNPSGKGLKPSVFVSRTRGTDRPANEPHQDKSSVGLKLSYGI